MRFAWLAQVPDAWKYERFLLDLQGSGYLDGLAPVPIPEFRMGPAAGIIDVTIGVQDSTHPCGWHEWSDDRAVINIAIGCSSDRLTVALTHELVETIADPGANHDELELADICQAKAPPAETTIDVDGDHYLVARYWSASKNGCFPFL